MDASEHLDQAELRSAEDRARHQTRVNRRLRVVLVVAAALLLVATGTGIYAERQSRKAETAADAASDAADGARHAAVAEQARRIGALGLLLRTSASRCSSPSRAALDDSTQTRTNLLAAMAASHVSYGRSRRPVGTSTLCR